MRATVTTSLPPTAQFDEAQARRIVLVRAFDTHEGPLWTAQDRAWATRLAAETCPADAPPARFLAERAHHALERLGPREPAIARWLHGGGLRAGWLVGAAVLGVAIGALTDTVGPGRSVDLLAPPVWALVAWNLVVYLLLAAAALRPARGQVPGPEGRSRGPAQGPIRVPALRGGWLRRLLQRFALPAVGRGAAAPALQHAAQAWAALGAPMALLRAGVLLHVAAALVAAGVAAGMYLRGTVLDYRAGWQSTFLDAGAVHTLLRTALAPASALTGIAVPDAAAIEALRLTPAAPAPGASAAPWIHLYAATLGLFVVAPRLLLALGAAVHARWRAARVPLALAEPYFHELLRHRRAGPAVVQVLPHGAAPVAQAALGLRAVLAQVYGDDVQLRMAAPVAYGTEDTAPAADAADARVALRLLLVDLAATPEAEAQGRLLAALRGSAAPAALVVLADEAGFRRRFANLPERVTERRRAWRELARAHAAGFASVDLETPDLAVAEAELNAALGAAAAQAAEVQITAA